MSFANQGQPETRSGCPMPPYNTNNFNSDSPTIFSTLQSYARTQPQFPLPPGSNARQITENQANVAYFNYINQQTIATKNQNGAPSFANAPYPQFKSEGERLKYIQGKNTTAARTAITGLNPAKPAGVPLSTIYQIINSE